MSFPPPPVPLYLDGDPDPAFAVFHATAAGHGRDTAVLLCPPFGWDEVCAYRSLREWGCQLARAGYPTVRVSYPSTGDSGGMPRDPDRVSAWRCAVRDAAVWVRQATGARRVVTIGIGLGGLIAQLAVVDGAPIDDLVSWGTPARGRSLVRQLRAFSRLEASQFFEGLPAPPPLAPGELEAGGFLLSAETVKALEAIDLSSVEIPAGEGRRALLLERDGLPVDEALRKGLESSGLQVTVASGDGYGEMTSHPQQARPAQALFQRVGAWLDEASAPAPTALPSVVAQPAKTEVRCSDGTIVTETVVAIGQSFGALSGVLVEPAQSPADGLCALLLNAGAVRRIGPSRMWVEVARHWAARGVATLRLDVEGIGDSDGDGTPYCDDGALYVASLVPQVLSAIDFLQARDVGERFALAGLCAGAYWSFHAALRDPRVCAALMINPRALIWDEGLAPARDLRVLLSERPSPGWIWRVATRQRVVALLRWLLGAPRRWLAQRHDPLARGGAPGSELDGMLEQFRGLGKRGLMLFSEREPLYEELMGSGRMAELSRSPTFTVEHIKVRDHTLRPSWAQGQLHEALERALERELASRPGAAESGAAKTGTATARRA